MARIIAAAVVLLSIFAQALALPDSAPYYFLDFSVNGREYRFELFLKDLNGTPDWKIGEAEPPITPNNAYLKAKAALNDSLPNLSEARVSQVTITRLAGEDGQFHTYYEFSFFSTDIDTKQVGSMQTVYRAPVVVLMDGTVISPRPVATRKPRS